ncbi:NAD(P)-binding protein [Lentinus tigrinus ALCF2SS1-7]|uniref:NAD(P)-binding protein n=1 Tax=Lentinus tigrinus ALCF2SS1-6 TaxID=1328759 RepID=A0A5C2S049_9APHY|nr:NAD(P)-binding protein [Lentinus tigrinus ALCF2SS1-6]RPD71638.1 NAD(P)-binding protein [Lentinus tigrinus ALCF2SS1-7]
MPYFTYLPTTTTTTRMGATLSYLWELTWQSFPPRTKFSTDQIPDLTGRVVLVTGGNSGIGYETCKRLLEHNARVYLAARSKEKADAAIASLERETGKQAIFLELDLADLSSVKHAAEEFLSREHELHILFNNAGVMLVPLDRYSKEGYDLQWATNVLGHFYLTELLMPALLAGVASSPDHHARVVTTSSIGAYAGHIRWESLKDGPARRKLRPEDMYFQSKLGNVIVAREVARQYADKGIISISVNPGNIVTQLYRYVPSLARKFLETFILWPVEYGALTQLYAGTMPEALNHNGEYMVPWARPGKCKAEAYDDELGREVWQWLQDAVKAHEQS